MKGKKIACGIFIYSLKNQNILICKSTGNYGGWSIPKGLIDEGETSMGCALREMEEETGLKMEDLDTCFITKLSDQEYKTGKKKLESFLFIIENDISDFKFECISLVDGKFPEISDYKLVNLDYAENIIHEAQAKKISEIKKIIYKF